MAQNETYHLQNRDSVLGTVFSRSKKNYPILASKHDDLYCISLAALLNSWLIRLLGKNLEIYFLERLFDHNSLCF
jgi:hypothetical protein